MRKIFITGITGQDGSYLAEQFLEKGCKVYGLVRRTSQQNAQNLVDIIEHKNLKLIEGDVTDSGCIHRIIHEIFPHEIYNLAAMSYVKASFDEPSHTWDVDAKGALNVLEAVRSCGSLVMKVYQASTSEMFGSMCSVLDKDGKRYNFLFNKNENFPGLNKFQDENTPFSPNSPYAIAKLAAHNLVHLYRESYGIYATSGILMNHESPRRGAEFVTRKITKWIGQVVSNKVVPTLHLGNPDARRDWGYAPDYMEAARHMLEAINPTDYVIATGKTHSVREFLLEALEAANLPSSYENDFVVWQTSSHMRPCEVPYLKGDASKAKRELDWSPKTSFKELVRKMVENDIYLARNK